MISRKIILLAGLFFSGVLFAQTAQLTASYQPQASAQAGPSLALVIDLAQKVNDGFLFELPGKTRLVPFAIKRNGATLWMKNENSEPKKNNAVHWDYKNNKLMVRFKNGLLQNGDRIEVDCTPHIVDTTAVDRRIVVKEFTAQTPAGFKGGQILDSQDFPLLRK